MCTFLTGRYGELRFVRKYDGDSPGLVGVAAWYEAALGDTSAEPKALWLLEVSPRLGIGFEYRFVAENGTGVTGVVCCVQAFEGDENTVDMARPFGKASGASWEELKSPDWLMVVRILGMGNLGTRSP